MKPLISIIIPVYNVEKYLTQCINSILSQKFSDYEIILVNDGSTDNSRKICEEFELNNDKITLINKSNGGLSSARNAGIKNSKGQYLMFIDSDDYLFHDENLKEIAYQIEKNNPDIIQYKMVYYYEKSKTFVNLKDLNIFDDDKSLKEKLYILINNGILSVSACDKVVKAEIIKNKQIFFEKSLLSEDIDWSLHLYLESKSLTTLNLPVYVYRQQRSGSITSKTKKKNIDSLLYIIEKWINFSYDDDVNKKIYYNYLAYQYVILLTIIDKKNCDKQTKKKIISYRWLLKYNDNYKVKLSNKVFKIFGLNIGIKILKIYLKFKNKGFIKL